MYFYNSVTLEKTYEHPLDKVYREKFLRLKAEKMQKKGKKAATIAPVSDEI
jgi:hypothetical protein